MPAKKKTTKKSSTEKTKAPKTDSTMPVVSNSKPTMSRKNLVILLVVVAVGLLTYKLGPWLFPASINSRPVSRFELYSRLESLYGEQVLEDMINNRILDLAIADSGAKVDQTMVDEQIASLESQFEGLGGLDSALDQQGLNREELKKQLYTQLAVEEILKEEIIPTEEEIQANYDAGLETLYADKSLDDVRENISESLRQDKLREAFLTWFSGVKEEYTVKKFDL